MILIFHSSFRLSEKNEKDKKRKALTPVSATPTHMLRICVNYLQGGKAKTIASAKKQNIRFVPSAHRLPSLSTQI